jgi:hypothetical protein
MRNLRLTKVVAIIKLAGQQEAVARLRECASEFLNRHERHQGGKSDD